MQSTSAIENAPVYSMKKGVESNPNEHLQKKIQPLIDAINDAKQQEVTILERPQSSSMPKSNKKQLKINTDVNENAEQEDSGITNVKYEIKDAALPGKDDAKLIADPKEKKSQTAKPGDCLQQDEGSSVMNESLDDERQASNNNPNMSTQSEQSDAQSSEIPSIPETEFEKIFKGILLYN